MPYQEIEIAGHPGYLYEPARQQDVIRNVIYLHGVNLGRLSDYPEFEQQFETHQLRVICPITQRSWWTDRICEEFDQAVTPERYILDHVVPWIESRFGSGPGKLALFGTSMGGQGALRFAYKHPDRFPVVAALAPAIDYYKRLEANLDDTLPLMYDEPEEARQDSATLHIHPLNWPRHQFFACCPSDFDWWESADRLRMKLYSLGVPHECDLETEGGGHGFPYYVKMAPKAFAFICERLEQEARRVE